MDPLTQFYSELDFNSGMRTLESHKDAAPSCGTILLLPLAIAIVIIGSEYTESSPCYVPIIGQDEYIIELQLFCYIAGYLQIGFSALVCLANACALHSEGHRSRLMKQSVNAPSFCLFLFYLAWAGIGMIIYCQQMTDECRKENIAKVMIAWSIFQYLMAAASCCFCGCLMCSDEYMMATNVIGSEDEQMALSADPL